MSLALSFHSLTSLPSSRHKILASKPQRSNIYGVPRPPSFRARCSSQEQPLPQQSRWENVLATAASLYPLYVTTGGALACVNPSAFSWFVERGPGSYSCALGFIMLAMGLTLDLKDFFSVAVQRPFSDNLATRINYMWDPYWTCLFTSASDVEFQILFGCAAQYTIMPAFGAIISNALGLSPALSVGLILLGCCPGGTASNVVTLIAQGDVPLSIVVTACTTLAAVFLTPLLTKILAGAYVSVDAVKLSISTLQVVVAPILLGSYMQNVFPAFVKVVLPFAPLLAVLASSLLASSVFSENLVRLKQSMVSASNGSDLGFKDILSGDLGAVILSVILLHFAGFFVGYISATICGFKERQRRSISIEVGMQNSSLGVVLATSHFTSPLVALPCAISAVLMNIMGSTLGFIWRYMDPSDPSNVVRSDGESSK